MRKNFYQMIEEIRNEYAELEVKNNRLKVVYDSLMSGLYQDKEFKRLEEQNKELEKRCCHYGLNDNNYKKLMEWWEEHYKKHESKSSIMKKKKDASYTIEIKEFAEVTVCSIKCDKCGEYHSVYL